MNIENDILSKKYAQAWINLYADKIDLQQIERVEALSNYFQKHRTALFYVQLSLVDDSETRKNMEHIFKSAAIDDLFKSLIELLIEDGRIFLLPRIMRHIYELYLVKHNIIDFTIETPVELYEHEKERLQEFLKDKTGKKIIYSLVNNPDLIAGVKIYSDTLGFENTMRQKLRRHQLHSLPRAM